MLHSTKDRSHQPFHQENCVREKPFHRQRSRSDHNAWRRFAVVGFAAFQLFCFATSAAATEPEEIDPDPNFASTSIVVEIFVENLAQLEGMELPPGRYLARVIDSEGNEEIYAIVVD